MASSSGVKIDYGWIYDKMIEERILRGLLKVGGVPTTYFFTQNAPLAHTATEDSSNEGPSTIILPWED